MADSDYAVTLIDAGAPVAVIRAEAIGLTGTDDADAVAAKMPFFAELRRSAARAMGLPDNDQSVPKVGIIGRRRRHQVELNARMISMSAPHPAIGLTSAVALAAAATIPGSLIHDLAPARPTYRIGTLSGPIDGRDHRGEPAAGPSPSAATPAASSMPSSTSPPPARPAAHPTDAHPAPPPRRDHRRLTRPPDHHPVLPLSPYQPSRHDGRRRVGEEDQ